MDGVRINLNIVVLGHIKSGKSALVERLVQEYNGFNQSDHEKFFMGTQLSNKNLTIDDVDKWEFDTSQYHCNIFDADGSSEFIKNMINGTSQADCALLMIDSTVNNSDTILEHARFAHTLGVTHMICCCNKMDATRRYFTTEYLESRFNEIVRMLSDELMIISNSRDIISFLPISVSEDENITNRSNKLGWYKGLTVVGAIEQMACIEGPRTFIHRPLRLSIYDADTDDAQTITVIGRVESGILRTNMKLIVAPSGATTRVRNLQIGKERNIEFGALPGDVVKFTVRDINPRCLTAAGCFASNPKDPVRKVKSFVSQVVILNSFGGEIKQGDTEIMYCNLFRSAVTFSEILHQINPKSGLVQAAPKKGGKVLKAEPAPLKRGNMAMVKMKPRNPILVEEFEKYPALGSFTIRKEGVTIAFGIIKSVKRMTEGSKFNDRSLIQGGSCISHILFTCLMESLTNLCCSDGTVGDFC